MDTRLIKHYEAELAFMREMGAEFAASYPKIAARLGLEGLEVLDPYIERLLEGVAFLNARTQLELEMQYPTFSSHVLDIVYPHFLCPTPSMMVAELGPDLQNASLEAGHPIPRDTVLRSKLVEGTQTACVFRTAHDVTLWPIEITEAEYIDGRGELVAAGVAGGGNARAAIRLRIRRAGGAPISELALQSLQIFLGAGEALPGWRLYEMLAAETTSVVARSTDRRADWTTQIADGVTPLGFEPEEALLPTPRRSYDGYRLLQEFFAMPERFHFIEIPGLQNAVARSDGDALDLYLLLKTGDAKIAPSITPEVFRLHCTPAVNLFERRCDRVLMKTTDHEQHVVVSRTAPNDYEVHSLLDVTGIRGEGESDVGFQPFYSAGDYTAASGGGPAYYTQMRRMRQRTERERLKGARSNYLGAEMYVSLVDPREAPYPGSIQQLSVRAMATNRDLPLLLAAGTPDMFHLPDGGPVKTIRTPVVPTRPRPTLAQGEAAWKLIGHLTLNYLSLVDSGDGTGAEALRELVGLYARDSDRGVMRELEGIVSVKSRPIVRRMADEVLSTAVRGLEITVECDEDFFDGASTYQLVAVLERFLRHHVSINSFTETVLVTQQRGEVARWQPGRGSGPIL